MRRGCDYDNNEFSLYKNLNGRYFYWKIQD